MTNMEIFRLYTEKKKGEQVYADRVAADIANTGARINDLRVFLRYDAAGISKAEFDAAVPIVFSEPPVDDVYAELPELPGYSVFAVEYLPGQYDQRADSCAQCVQLLTQGARPLIACATVYAVKGADRERLAGIKKMLINPVEAREASLERPKSLCAAAAEPDPVPVVFLRGMDAEALAAYHAGGFAMSAADLEFVRGYFINEGRDPTETELKVLDTYWSDHCRHTTFLTELTQAELKTPNPHIAEALELYHKLFDELYADRPDKYKCLMDIATIGARKLKKAGKLPMLDESEEINACSIKVKSDDGDYLVMFKNETHNHPTEIEPFGGAATCLGGAIRDPLSGRSYVYQAMRATGAADPTVPISETIKGKLPQRALTRTAAAGFSSYGNQIGLATGQVKEMYHPGYAAKRLEMGMVIGAVKAENVVRKVPEAGDIVVLIGGATGRDGCGGATGSSQGHTADSAEKGGAEVQKGTP
ncbi:MAG: phosphoribosylformylglycinamidine synthase, partial [Firmicutes bacterium]|nr:phosphoribosylformylglycinamidine synthase [Bacillota bacterium]